MNPMDYSLCCQTVTLYRNTEKGICRRVVENAYLSRKDSRELTDYGQAKTRPFTLILPGNADICCGDRVWEGIGPREVAWEKFLPAAHEELMEVGYVQKHRWDGQVCHVQAGSR